MTMDLMPKVRQSQTGVDPPTLTAVTGEGQELNQAGRRHEEAWLADRLSLNPREAARALGVGHDAIYGLLNAKRLRSVYVGSRRLIPVSELRRFLEEDAK